MIVPPTENIIVTPRIERFRKFLEGSRDKRIIALYGGAGSGKSVAVAQWICELFVSGENLNILVARKSLPSLKLTAMRLIRNILRTWAIPFEENKTDGLLTYRTNTIFFKSLDDPEKIKSFDASLIWVEEATEIDWDTYLQLNLRARAPGEKNQIFYTFNPVDARHWTVTEIIDGRDHENIVSMHSTWRDNRFLPIDYIKQLFSLKEKDENYYRIYTLGLPGMIENLIYSNYQIEYFNFEDEPNMYGLDLGYNDPNALLAVWIRDQKLYVKQIIYATGQDPNMLVDDMSEKGVAQGPPIYCDHRTDIIELLNKSGFNAQKADKKVTEGILFTKSQKLVIHEESIDLIRETQRYKWMKDKNNKILDTPVDFQDHLMDALRYAVYTHRDRGNMSATTIGDIIGGSSIPDGLGGY
jgi:phage terminase large subunit